MTYIIAELGSVHDGSLGNACRLIHECAWLGADAVKLQDHRGEKVKGDPPWFKGGEQRGDYLKRTSFNQEQWARIRTAAWESGNQNGHISLVVSPFSVEAVELQESLRLPGEQELQYKIASGQVTNLPMLEAVAKTGRRVILSSGMTTGDELDTAAAITESWAILQCTSEYPCASERVGLNVIAKWAKDQELVKFDRAWRIGLSDHTLGFAASLAAIALGATVIERHVCFDRRGYGTDCAHSLTLDEFGAFVKEARALDVMLANPVDKDALVQTTQLQAMRAAFLEQP